MKEHMKRTNTKKFGIILVVMLAIVITIFYSSYVIFNELEAQLQKNLEDVAAQNALALHNKIHSNYELPLIIYILSIIFCQYFSSQDSYKFYNLSLFF